MILLPTVLAAGCARVAELAPQSNGDVHRLTMPGDPLEWNVIDLPRDSGRIGAGEIESAFVSGNSRVLTRHKIGGGYVEISERRARVRLMDVEGIPHAFNGRYRIRRVESARPLPGGFFQFKR